MYVPHLDIRFSNTTRGESKEIRRNKTRIILLVGQGANHINELLVSQPIFCYSSTELYFRWKDYEYPEYAKEVSPSREL